MMFLLFSLAFVSLLMLDYFRFYQQLINGIKTMSTVPNEMEVYPRVSVVIAARNEATTLPQLLTQLVHQHYPADCFEVIVVNDHSEDGTWEWLNSFEYPTHFNIRLVTLPLGESGKKMALSRGIRGATGDWILTTDADTNVQPNWIKQMMLETTKHPLHAVCGPVSIKPVKSPLEQFQFYDVTGLVAIGAGLIAIGRPSLANGANLAFKKSSWEALGGYSSHETIASGDDEFLVMSLHRKFPNSVRFCHHADAVVTTTAQASWKALMQQRLRWAGKHRHYQSPQLKFLLARIYLFHLALISFIVAGFIQPVLWLFLMLLWLLKEWAENRLLQLVLNRWNLPFSVWNKWKWQPAHWFFIVSIGLLANVQRSYTWKGRRIGN